MFVLPLMLGSYTSESAAVPWAEAERRPMPSCASKACLINDMAGRLWRPPAPK